MNAQELLDSTPIDYTEEEKADLNITKICKKNKTQKLKGGGINENLKG